MRIVTATCLFGLVFFVANGVAKQQSPKPDVLVDLKFVPQESVGRASIALPPSMLDRAVRFSVEDSRKQTDLRKLGEGTEGGDQVFQILASGDVIKFTADAIEKMVEAQGLKKADSSAPQLDVRVARFAVSESKKAVGSMYSAEVHLGFLFKTAEGKTTAEGAAAGLASRYGRARSAANCAEVLSDALKEAFVKLLGDEKLQAAWKFGVDSHLDRLAPKH